MAGPDKRDRIFQATVDLLLEQGLLAVQTRAVTERAGVGTGLLNHYFRWPDLRAAAWAAIFDEVAQNMRHPEEPAKDALDRFFAEAFADEARPLWRLWIEAEGLAVQDPPLARAVTKARGDLRDGLTAILTENAGQSDGTPADPRRMAVQIEAARDGLAGLLLVNDPEVDAAAAETFLRQTFARMQRG